MSDDIFNSSDEFFRELEGIYGQGPEAVSGQDADSMLEGLSKEQRDAVTHLDGPLLILAGAGSGNPEVVSPLNQLKQLMGGGDNAKILEVLNRIYEMLYLSRNQGQQQEISAEIDGNTLFKAIVRQNEIYKDTHRGRSAFA